MPTSPKGTHYDDDELDSLFSAIGFVVVQWGQAEQSLDLITALLYQSLGGNQYAKRLPKMLGKKLEFLGTCLEQIPTCIPLRDEGEALITSFRDLSNKRHDLIHGAISSLSAKDGAFKFAKLDIKDDIHVLREFSFDAADFPKLSKELIELGSKAVTFGHQLSDIAKS